MLKTCYPFKNNYLNFTLNKLFVISAILFTLSESNE